MYDDLISGSISSPGLLDLAFTAASDPTFNQLWTTIRTSVRDFLVFSIDLMQGLSSWIRDTPIVLAVIALFFVGFVVSIFFRVYKSA